MIRLTIYKIWGYALVVCVFVLALALSKPTGLVIACSLVPSSPRQHTFYAQQECSSPEGHRGWIVVCQGASLELQEPVQAARWGS